MIAVTNLEWYTKLIAVISPDWHHKTDIKFANIWIFLTIIFNEKKVGRQRQGEKEKKKPSSSAYTSHKIFIRIHSNIFVNYQTHAIIFLLGIRKQ